MSDAIFIIIFGWIAFITGAVYTESTIKEEYCKHKHEIYKDIEACRSEPFEWEGCCG